MTPLSADEARQALADIERTTRQMQRALAGSGMSTGLMTGGVMWVAGFTLNFFFPELSGRIWWLVSSLGMAFIAFSIYRQHRKGEVKSAEKGRHLRQISFFWVAVMGYLLAICLMLPRMFWADQLLLIVTFLMFAYVVMGIWLQTPILVTIGLAVTALAWAGRLLLPPRYFLLWMAVFGGGGLFLPGLYVKLRWK